MYNEIMHTMPNPFHRILDRFKTQDMCNKAIEVDPWQLKDVSDRFKTQEMYDEAVRNKLCMMSFVPCLRPKGTNEICLMKMFHAR